jgi:WD40 repeat protein
MHFAVVRRLRLTVAAYLSLLCALLAAGLALTGSASAQGQGTGSGVPIHVLTGHSGAVLSLVVNSDGTKFATGGLDGAVRIWNAATGEVLHTVREASARQGDDAVGALVFSPDGDHLAAGGADRIAQIWDLATGRLLATMAGHTDVIRDIAFSPDALGRFNRRDVAGLGRP